MKPQPKITFLRDGLSLEIDGKPRVVKTPDGHVVETYKQDGVRKYFVTLVGSYFCAHGDTLASAIADAVWKDETRRPSMDAVIASIKKTPTKKITLNEFRLITGACLEGCRAALKQKGLDDSPLPLKEIKKLWPDWAAKIEQKLAA